MSWPLGVLGSGPLGWVGDDSVLNWTGSAAADLQWWVVAEDRLHRPPVEPTLRLDAVDDTPVVRASVRIPSGDATARVAAVARRGGVAALLEVHNDSPVPVAVAVVLRASGPVQLDGSVLLVDGERFEFNRRPAAALRADSLDELAARVPEAADLDVAPTGEWVAVVLPLPHAQRVTCSIGSEPGESLPGLDQVLSGWANQVDRGASFTAPPVVAQRLLRARYGVAVGVAGDAAIAEWAAQVGAWLRLGWFREASEATDRLLAWSDRPGRRDDVTAVAVLDALAAWRVAGVPQDRLEPIVVGTANWARRVAKRRKKWSGPLAVAAELALDGATRLIRLSGGDAPESAVPVVVGSLPADLAAIDAIQTVESLVADRAAGVVLVSGWDSSWAGSSIDARDVPTSWGRFGFSIRWHGARPALLWEFEPWPDVDVTGEPTVVAPTLAPGWSATGWSGEVLLEAPDVPVQLGRSRS